MLGIGNKGSCQTIFGKIENGNMVYYFQWRTKNCFYGSEFVEYKRNKTDSVTFILETEIYRNRLVQKRGQPDYNREKQRQKTINNKYRSTYNKYHRNAFQTAVAEIHYGHYLS